MVDFGKMTKKGNKNTRNLSKYWHNTNCQTNIIKRALFELQKVLKK